MINKIITLFKIARKLAQSDVIKIIEKFHKPPKIIKIFSYLLSFSLSGSNKLVNKKTYDGSIVPGEVSHNQNHFFFRRHAGRWSQTHGHDHREDVES